MIFYNVDIFKTWHSRLGYPGIGLMRSIIWNCICYDLKDAKISKSNDFVCTSCAMEKLILQPSPLKIHAEPLKFLECIQGDICHPIQPLCGPFRYFMVLVNESTRRLTHNHILAKFMTQVIRLKMNYPEYRIKSIHMDNTAKFSSRAFNDYSMAHGIEVQHFFHMFIHKMVWQNL
jgi:hypothetical protein